MLKITAIVSLMLIGSTLWAASLTCESCGKECASACGTRHFRSCCFNYLRRKRVPDAPMFLLPYHEDSLKESLAENAPEQYLNYPPSEFKPYFVDDTFENRMLSYNA